MSTRLKAGYGAFFLLLLVTFFLKPLFGVINSYLIDQLLFALIIIIYVIFGMYLRKIEVSRTDVLVFIVLLLIPLITHAEIFQRYFYQEDFRYNLSTLRVSDIGDFYGYNSCDTPCYSSYYIVYPFLPFVILYKFFQADVNIYNLFTLVFLSSSAFFLYKLNQISFIVKSNVVNIISFIISLIYMTSPTYLESYVWISVGLEGGFVYSLMLIGIILYIFFLRNRSSYYFLGAFLVLLFLIKTSFARAGFLPLIFILLEILFLNRKNFKSFLIRCVLLISPTIYFLLQIGLIKQIFDRSGGNFGENVYALFAYLPQTIIPFGILSQAYPFFQKTFLFQIQLLKFNFFFTFGLLIFSSLLGLVFVFRNKIIFRLYLFIIISALICLFFFVNFGHLGKVDAIETFDMNLSRYFSGYSVTIGNRYFQGVNVLFNCVFFILLSALIGKFPKTRVFVIILLLVALIYNIRTIQIRNEVFSRDYGTIHKVFYEGILGLVPADDQKKILYLTNGDKWSGRINTEPSTFEAFYPTDTVVYINSKSNLLEEVKKGNYDKENFYAFYLDYDFGQRSYRFIDRTEEYRKKVFDKTGNL